MSEPEIRTIAPDELEPLLRTLESSFGSSLKPQFLELERMIARPDRYLAALDGGRIVGANLSIPVELTVPGGRRVTACGVNGVGTAPGATRRGVSTALMRRQLQDARERQEPVAVLHASESAIYGRYGFGVATRNAHLEVDAARSAFVRGFERRGDVRLVERAEALEVMTATRSAGSDRPGWVGPAERFADWTLTDMELDDDFDGPKEDPPFFAVHEAGDARDGVAIYRIKHDWPDSTPRNRAIAYTIAASSPSAHAELWRFLLDLDLVGVVDNWNVPIDEPLFRLVQEPRALKMRIRDGLHVALVDLPTALEARSYAGTGRVRLRVRDGFSEWNDGTWELAVDAGTATCRRTDAEPDLSISATDLAATYLGDVTFAQLAAALLVEGSPEAIATVDQITATHRVPWTWLLV